MVITCIGVSHNVGVSSKTGKNYNFYSMQVMQPISTQREGYGYDAYSKTINETIYQAIVSGTDKYPVRLDIDCSLNGYINGVKVVK